jgi:hypothetical protein
MAAHHFNIRRPIVLVPTRTEDMPSPIHSENKGTLDHKSWVTSVLCNALRAAMPDREAAVSVRNLIKATIFMTPVAALIL